MRAGPNGRYFDVKFCLSLYLLRDFSVSSCTLQRDQKDHSVAQLLRIKSDVNPLRNLLPLLPCRDGDQYIVYVQL